MPHSSWLYLRKRCLTQQIRLVNRSGSHCSAYELLRFCRYLSTVHTTPFCPKIQIKISFFVGSHCSQQRRKKSVSVVLTLSQCCCRDKYLSFLRSHWSTAFDDNPHLYKYPLRRAFCKPPYLCVLCGIVWTVWKKRRCKSAFLYNNREVWTEHKCFRNITWLFS